MSILKTSMVATSGMLSSSRREQTDVNDEDEKLTNGVAIRIIQEVVSAIGEDEWEALTDAVLRKVACGQAPDVSAATRKFARDLLLEREARVPDPLDE